MADRTEKVEKDTVKFPECWSDDKRMSVLLAEFRPRHLNTVGYDSKMKFWKDLIISHCKSTGCSAVSIFGLKESFRRNGTNPYCLSTVFDDMINKGELLEEANFEQQQSNSVVGWSFWAFDKLVTTPLKWGYGTARRTLLGPIIPDEDSKFIVTEVAKQHGQIIENAIEKRDDLCNRLISVDDLVKYIIKSTHLTTPGVQPALILLAQRKRISNATIQCGDDQVKLIKFAKPNAAVQPITPFEISIHELEQSANVLTKDICTVEHNINQTMLEIREFIRNGRKQMAKAHLKKKYILEKNMQQKISALETVQELLTKIQNTQSDKNIIEIYKLGAHTLKKAFEDAGITVDQVDDIMSEVKDVFEQHNEIISMISTVSTSDDEELELERELGDLIDLELSENNIESNDLPAQVDTKVENVDTEIENRLAALKIDTSDIQQLIHQELQI